MRVQAIHMHAGERATHAVIHLAEVETEVRFRHVCTSINRTACSSTALATAANHDPKVPVADQLMRKRRGTESRKVDRVSTIKN